MKNQTRSILAILSTDIPGYTEKTEKDENQLEMLKKNTFTPWCLWKIEGGM